MSKSAITYQSGGTELLNQIRHLWEQLNQHHAVHSPHFANEFQVNSFAKRKAKLLKKYADEQLRVDLAQSQGRSIGYLVSAVSTDGVGEIESIFIEAQFRGQGIADELMQRGLAWLDAHNVHTKVIAVAVGNERAYSFYERYGFYPRLTMLKQRDNA